MRRTLRKIFEKFAFALCVYLFFVFASGFVALQFNIRWFESYWTTYLAMSLVYLSFGMFAVLVVMVGHMLYREAFH